MLLGSSACATCCRREPPPQESLPRWRRMVEGLRHSRHRDAQAIGKHYDVSNALLREGARPVDGLHLRGVPEAGRQPGGGPGGEVRPGRPQARPGAGHAAARRRLRLGRHGPARGQALRRAARSGSPCRPSRPSGARPRSSARAWPARCEILPQRLPRRAGRRLRRGQLDRPDSSTSGSPTTRPTSASCKDKLRDGGRLLNHCITRPDNNAARRCPASSSTATSFPTAS